MSKLTICSVFHNDKTKKLLELNQKHTKDLNPKSEHGWYEWLVKDNTNDIGDYDMKASYEVARALNELATQVKTKYALFLDSDFFIVRENWVQDVLDYMKKKNLMFLGVPWHPKWFKKIRYFPAEHCLFVDIRKVGVLDFTPAPQEHEVPLFVARLPIWLRNNLEPRYQIGTSRDVGYRIYRSYKSYRNECFKPVFRPKRIIPFIPDRFSYTPKRSSFTKIGFKEHGLKDTGFEEFMWKGKPFGFHMRGTQNKATAELARELLY